MSTKTKFRRFCRFCQILDASLTARGWTKHKNTFFGWNFVPFWTFIENWNRFHWEICIPSSYCDKMAVWSWQITLKIAKQKLWSLIHKSGTPLQQQKLIWMSVLKAWFEILLALPRGTFCHTYHQVSDTDL